MESVTGKSCLKFNKKYNKALLSGFIFASLCGLMVYQWSTNVDCDNLNITASSFTHNSSKFVEYLIYNEKCKIPNINPWDENVLPFLQNISYAPYAVGPQLVDMERREDRVLLVFKRTSVEISTCVACDVERYVNHSRPDHRIIYTNCQNFTGDIEMQSPVIDVKCYKVNEDRIPFYKEVFANYVWKDKPHKVRKRKPYNVLIIGIDSISRLNFIRMLKKTYKFLLADNWVEYVAYNKVGENTLPNLMALLCGKDYLNYDKNTFADQEMFIWKDYKRFGYTTVFAEDHKTWGTFQFYLNGFQADPTDFYFRPYTIAMELGLRRERLPAQNVKTIFSAGGRIIGDRIFELVTELPKACKDEPYFGFFWMNTFSHDDINTPQLMDDHIVDYMTDLQQNNVFNDTILLFLSDHGMREGNVRRTVAGSYEDRLPFLFVRAPDHFKDTHPEAYKNLIENRKKLTSTFDLHMTLQHILTLSKLNHTVKAAMNCPKCLSIFEELPTIRSCAEAGIADGYCACIKMVEVTNQRIVNEIAEHVVRAIENIIEAYSNDTKRCRKLVLSHVLHARIEEKPERQNKIRFKIMLETKPKTTIEAVLHVALRNDRVVSQSIIGGPYRIDRYSRTGYCCDDVNEHNLQKFCYCHEM